MQIECPDCRKTISDQTELEKRSEELLYEAHSILSSVVILRRYMAEILERIFPACGEDAREEIDLIYGGLISVGNQAEAWLSKR